MTTTRRILLVAIVSLFVPQQAVAIFQLNVFRPYNINLRTPRWPGEPFQMTSWSEFGTKAKGYNAEGKEVNELQIFNGTQNALAMVQGITGATEEQKKLITKFKGIKSKGTRGQVRFTGDFNVKAGFGINARYHFPYNISFGVFVPFYSMRLKNVQFKDLTPNVAGDDLKVKENLTSKLPEVVSLFDPDYNLMDGWKETGIGDVALMVEWWRDFPQAKPMLKNVAINARGGVSLPTSKKTDINNLFPVPFGCDGLTALIFGGGLVLAWFECLPFINQVRGGFDLQFWQLFGNTRERRIKTDKLQTDLLLLTREQVHRDYGFTQRYNVYLEAYRLFRGLSVSATYQFFKQSESTLSLCTNQFSETIANTDNAIDEWTFHHILFAASYDTECDVCEDSILKPQFKFIYKFPFDGQRSITINSFTLVCSINF